MRRIQYTYAEYRLLRRFIKKGNRPEEKEFISNMRSIDERYLKPEWKNTLGRKVYRMLCLPLIKVPLFISDKENFILSIVRWRLSIGK